MYAIYICAGYNSLYKISLLVVLYIFVSWTLAIRDRFLWLLAITGEEYVLRNMGKSENLCRKWKFMATLYISHIVSVVAGGFLGRESFRY